MMLSRALLLFALLWHSSSAVMLERQSHKPTKDVSSEEQPPPDSHESKEELCSEMPPPGSNEDSSGLEQGKQFKMDVNLTIVVPGISGICLQPAGPRSSPSHVSCSRVDPQPITAERENTPTTQSLMEKHFGAQKSKSVKRVSETEPDKQPLRVKENESEYADNTASSSEKRPIPPGMTEDNEERETESSDQDDANNPKPKSRTSPTYKPSNSLLENVSNSGDEVGNTAYNSENRPYNIYVTQKDQYPSFNPKPWIYPQPIFKGMSATTPTEEPVKHTEGQENESGSSDNDGSTASNSDNRPFMIAPQTPQYPFEVISTNKPEDSLLGQHFGSSDKEGSTPSNSENGPSISATQKTPYPFEIISTNKPENGPLGQHIGHQESESGSSDKHGSTPSNSENRPHIFATQKSHYPSFVHGPWIYPKPTYTAVFEIISTNKPEDILLGKHIGGQEDESGSTNKPEDILLGKHIGGQEDESGSSDKEGSTPSNSENRPHIFATQKSHYRSFVPRPSIYPKPTYTAVFEIISTNKPENILLGKHIGGQEDESGSTNKPEDILLGKHIGGQEDESGSSDKHGSTPSNSENRPHIFATQESHYPSSVHRPLIYPKPTYTAVFEIISTNKPEDILLGKHIGGQEDESGSSDKEGNTPSNSENRPHIFATQESHYPSFVHRPSIYPKPTYTIVFEIISTNKPEDILLGKHIGGQEDESGSTNKPEDILLGKHIGGQEDESGSTNKPEDILLGKHIGGQEDESGSSNKHGSTPSNSENRPSITEAHKPLYPFEITLTNKPEGSPLWQHFGGQKNEPGSSDKEGSTPSNSKNRPYISATEEPQYPSFFHRLSIYPKPTFEVEFEITSTIKPEASSLGQHIGGQENESGSSDKDGSTPSHSKNWPYLSATQNPPYPFEITSMRKPEEVLLGQHIGGQGRESGSSDKEGSTLSNSKSRPSIFETQEPKYPFEITSTIKPEASSLGQHFGGQENESGSSDKDGSTPSNSENRPHISATQEPEYLSFVPGPSIYPKPTFEIVFGITSTNKPENGLLGQHIGGQENESGSSDKEGSTPSANWASQEPRYPFEITSTIKPEVSPLAQHFGSQENEIESSDSTPINSENMPSTSATQDPQYLLFLPALSVSRKPATKVAFEIKSTNKPENHLLGKHIGSQENEIESSDSTPSNSENMPSQNPQYSSFVHEHSINPTPTEEGVSQISTMKPEQFGLEETESRSSKKVVSSSKGRHFFKKLMSKVKVPQAPSKTTTTEIPDDASYVSGPHPSTDVQLAEHQGGTAASSEQMAFPGPTAGYPPKEPAKRLGLLTRLRNTENEVMSTD